MMNQKKTVTIKVTRTAVRNAFQKYCRETGATEEDCLNLLKDAAFNSQNPKNRELALAALKEILI